MRIILLLASLLSLSSCAHYQYLSISSDTLKPNGRNELVMESDTLDIIYNFHGKGGPVTVTIYNRSMKALQVDWKRSALIIGGKPLVYYDAQMQVNRIPGTSWRSGDPLVATISSDNSIDFIPPGSSISRGGLMLSAYPLPAGHLKEETISKNGFKSRIRQADYTPDDSPLPFRSYITFIHGPAGSEEFVVDHSFYVSQIVETHSAPALNWDQDPDKGNEFYLKSLSRTQGAGALIAGVALTTFIIARGADGQ